MSMVMDIAQDRKDRPAYVRFERVPVEDKAASVAAGRYVARDVDFALITPPYSRDIFKQKVRDWFTQMKQDVASGRMPPEWEANYRKAYEAWRNGQEIPLEGTPIKGWGVISPALQETLIRLNILTVEDLARATDEGMRAIGMGSMELKSKAAAWLASMNDHGGATLRMAALETENGQLKGSVATLQRQVEELLAVVKMQGGNAPAVLAGDDISASELLDDDIPAGTAAAAAIPTAPKRRRAPGQPEAL